MSNLIYLAEDDMAARESIVRALALEGYELKAFGDGQSLLDASAQKVPDLYVLDVMMPVTDGLETCTKLRERGDSTPVLMVTARTEISDRVSGLDAGADDYLPKPFALEELLARVRALLRRTATQPGGDETQAGDLKLNLASRRAWRGDREMQLTKTEFELLELLARNAGTALTHSQIYEEIWGYDFGPDSKSLAVYIGYLRRKTEEGGEARVVETVRSIGYRFKTE